MSSPFYLVFILAVMVAMSIAVIYVYFIRKANAAKSKWGINIKAIIPGKNIKCPECGNELPKMRKPANLKQALWGGFTCKTCGNEYDKWLNKISS